MTARFFGAEEALRVGLVSAVYGSKKEALEAAMRLGVTLAGKSPVAVQSTKALVNYSVGRSVQEGVFSSSSSPPQTYYANTRPRPAIYPIMERVRPADTGRSQCDQGNYATEETHVFKTVDPDSSSMRTNVLFFFFFVRSGGGVRWNLYQQASKRASRILLCLFIYFMWLGLCLVACVAYGLYIRLCSLDLLRCGEHGE